jgi:glycosyltransferase involved in cell wall biosynthesis
VSRVLIVTADVLRPQMAGPAMRAWHTASHLARENEVWLLTTSPYCELAGEGFEVAAASSEALYEAARWSEVVVLQGYVTHHNPWLLEREGVTVFDVYDPLHLETLALTQGIAQPVRDAHVQVSIETLNRQLERADFLICATERQRDLFVGQLCALGRVNPLTYDEDPTLRRLIDVVPFGLPDKAPVHSRPALRGVVPGIEADDDLIVWAGGVYDWFDPLTLVQAVASLAERRPKVRLFFMGMRHPNPDVPEMRMAARTRALAEELGVSGKNVFFNEGWVAYDDRENFLTEADVGVTAHFDSAETRYSFRTRCLDYLWAALPVVTTRGDAFAALVEGEGLGIAVPPEDPGALEEALARLLEDKDVAESCRTKAAQVRELYRWSVALEPLAAFCRRPRRAPDLLAGGFAFRRPEPAGTGGKPGPRPAAPGGDEEQRGEVPGAGPAPPATEEPPAGAPAPPADPPRPRTVVELARHHYQQGGLGQVANRVVQKAYRIALGRDKGPGAKP